MLKLCHLISILCETKQKDPINFFTEYNVKVMHFQKYSTAFTETSSGSTFKGHC